MMDNRKKYEQPLMQVFAVNTVVPLMAGSSNLPDSPGEGGSLAPAFEEEI